MFSGFTSPPDAAALTSLPPESFGTRGDEAGVAADVPDVDELRDGDGAGPPGAGVGPGQRGFGGSSRPVSSMVPDGGAAASAGSATQPRATGIQVCGEAPAPVRTGASFTARAETIQ